VGDEPGDGVGEGAADAVPANVIKLEMARQTTHRSSWRKIMARKFQDFRTCFNYKRTYLPFRSFAPESVADLKSFPLLARLFQPAQESI
jgi:hypothetical protein